MNDIPNIAFSKKSRIEIDFEIFSIRSLFSRLDRIDNELDKPHRIDFHHIVYITRGSGFHTIDFKPYRYSEGSIYFISKGQVHAFDLQSDADGYIIIFTEEFLTKNLIHADILSFFRLYNYHLQTPIIQPDETGGDVFKSIIKEMYWEYLLSNDFAKEEILRLLLKLLLLRAERINQTRVSKGKNAEWFATFTRFKNHVEQQFAQTRNASDYAKMMNISYKHLNEVCKSITGNTAKTFIDQFIILETKRQLAISDMPVKELTYILGFDEPTNFVKFFKKHTHQSPSQFKKTLTQ